MRCVWITGGGGGGGVPVKIWGKRLVGSGPSPQEDFPPPTWEGGSWKFEWVFSRIFIDFADRKSAISQVYILYLLTHRFLRKCYVSVIIIILSVVWHCGQKTKNLLQCYFLASWNVVNCDQRSNFKNVLGKEFNFEAQALKAPISSRWVWSELFLPFTIASSSVSQVMYSSAVW